jgi:hypothetical protein
VLKKKQFLSFFEKLKPQNFGFLVDMKQQFHGIASWLSLEVQV